MIVIFAQVKSEPEGNDAMLVIQEAGGEGAGMQAAEVQQMVQQGQQGQQEQVVQQIGSIISAVQQHESHQLAQAYLNPTELLDTYRRINTT